MRKRRAERATGLVCTTEQDGMRAARGGEASRNAAREERRWFVCVKSMKRGEDGERARDRREEGLQRAPEAVVERSVPILISTLQAPIPPFLTFYSPSVNESQT